MTFIYLIFFQAFVMGFQVGGITASHNISDRTQKELLTTIKKQCKINRRVQFRNHIRRKK